jgi:hypothetical protein
LAAVNIHSRNFEAAEGHCERCLAHPRRLKGGKGEETNVAFQFKALRSYSNLREQQHDYKDALTYAEGGYNLGL